MNLRFIFCFLFSFFIIHSSTQAQVRPVEYSNENALFLTKPWRPKAFRIIAIGDRISVKLLSDSISPSFQKVTLTNVREGYLEIDSTKTIALEEVDWIKDHMHGRRERISAGIAAGGGAGITGGGVTVLVLAVSGFFGNDWDAIGAIVIGVVALEIGVIASGVGAFLYLTTGLIPTKIRFHSKKWKMEVHNIYWRPQKPEVPVESEQKENDGNQKEDDYR